MANANAPRGARPVMFANGSPYTGQNQEVFVDASNATAIFVGDFVKQEDDGNFAPAAAGDTIYSRCAGFRIDPAVAAIMHPGYLPASTAGYMLVDAGSADLLYEIQEDSVGGALAATASGSNVDIIAGAGNTTSGLSGHQIDSSTSTDASPGSAQLRLIEIVKRVDNEIGANCKWLVRINESAQSSHTATGL